MMYRILLDGHDIYGSNPETAVIDPHLDIELNSAGSLEFTLPVDNYDWDTPQVFTNEVEVIEDGEVIFFGRPLQITRDWNNQKKVVCEGALAYFNDTIQRTHEYKTSSHTTLEAFFRHLIDVHNSQVDDQIGSSYSPKHFEVGTVDLENKGKYVYRKTDYQTTLECLQQMCLDTDGGYFVLRKEYDNDGNATRYIDWLEQMPYGSDQPVQFGLNLLDLSRDLNGADICTVLIPLGGENLTLSNFSSKDPDDPNNIYPGVGHVKTSDEIYYKPGVELYGRVVKQKTWSDYTSQDGLWRKAAEWLTRKNDYVPTIEVDAADLHYIDEYKDHGESLYSVFRVGMAVQVISKPHGFDEDTIDGESHPNLIIHKLSLDLDSATKKVTIGTPPKRELTDILAPSSGGKTTKGSGGNGDDGPIYSVSEIYPVTEIMIKKEGETEYSSAISNKTAYIDLTTGVGGNVKDVQVDGVSVVDPETGIAVIDSSLAVGRLQDISWYERGPNDTEESNTRTTTLTEDGIYVAVIYYSWPMNYDNFMMIGEFSLTTNASNIIREEYIDYKLNATYGAIARGKTIIFEGHAGDTVTFHANNNRFNLLASRDIPSNPHEAGCYEIDKTNHIMIVTSDTSRDYSKDYYAIINPEGSDHHHEYIVGTMEHVFKIGNVDSRYLSYIGEYFPTGQTYNLKTLIPNTDDTYLVYALIPNNNAVQPVVYVEDGSEIFYDSISMSDDPNIFQSLIASDKRIIHIGDGTYDSTLNSSHSYLNNSHNVAYLSGSYNSTYIVDGLSYAAINSGKDFNSKSALNLRSTGSSEGDKYVIILRISKPEGVLDVQVDNQSIVDENGIANLNSSDFGTTVVANPSGTATDDLTKVQIGDTVYDIPGGGGGGGQHYTCDLLFENDPLPSPTSGTANVTRNYTLSKSIDDYDAVYIIAYGYHASRGNANILPTVIFKKDYYLVGFDTYGYFQNSSNSSKDRHIICTFTDSTHVSTLAVRSESGNEPILYKVYGIKWPATTINRPVYLSDYYSEEEREVGRSTNGKPIYQKTWNGLNITMSVGQWKDTTIPSDGIETIINSSGILTYPNNTYNANLDCRIVDGQSYVKVMSQNFNVQTLVSLTLQYTKTTDVPEQNPTLGNVIYLPTIYSEEEREVGVWTDGKPVYQRVKYISGPWPGGTTDSLVFDLSAWNVERVCFSNFVMGPSTDSPISYAHPYVNNNNAAYAVGINITVDRKVYINVGNNSYVTGVRMLIQYTKTTDTPGSGTWTPDGSLAHHYSLNEHIVGTWVDGSTRWEKTVFCGALPNSAEKDISSGLTNEHVISIDGYSYSPTGGATIKINHTAYPASGMVMASYLHNTHKIHLYTASDRSAYTETYITIQYTKSS